VKSESSSTLENLRYTLKSSTPVGHQRFGPTLPTGIPPAEASAVGGSFRCSATSQQRGAIRIVMYVSWVIRSLISTNMSCAARTFEIRNSSSCSLCAHVLERSWGVRRSSSYHSP